MIARSPPRAMIRSMAIAMRDELERSRLEVVLVPSRDPQTAARGGMIRCAVDRNPLWYRELCAGSESQRRGKRRLFQTLIKRRGTLRALARIALGEPAGMYGERLLPVIAREIDRARERLRYEREAWRASRREAAV